MLYSDETAFEEDSELQLAQYAASGWSPWKETPLIPFSQELQCGSHFLSVPSTKC